MVASRKNDTLLSTLLTQWPLTDIHCPKIEIGLSGGVDSVVLTHLLYRLQDYLDFSLSAVYVHHGLSHNAQSWADFCATFCLSFNIPFRIAYVQLDSDSSLGIEAEARKQRYQVYHQSSADFIALAHHQDDQVETALLQFLRGGGPQALAAMPQLRMDRGKHFWRPLLGIAKQDLLRYARQNNLSFVEDESNMDEGFRRNWIRHTLLPTIKSVIPDIDAHLLRTVALMQDYSEMINEVTEQDILRLTAIGYFDCTKWRKLGPARRRATLLRFVQSQQLGTPRPESIEDFACQLGEALPGKQICWSLPEGKLYAYQNRLYPVAQEFTPYQSSVLVKDINPRSFGQYKLYWKKHHLGIPKAIIEQGVLLTGRKGGESLAFRDFHKTVKTCLQEQKIPPFLRQNWPVILDKNTGQCIAIANVQVGFFDNLSDERFFPMLEELF